MSDGRRSIRLFFKFGLLVSLPLAGYLWAQMGVTPATVALSALCVVMAFGSEGFASSAESQLSRLRALAENEEKAFSAQIASRVEKIQQMDRIIESLSNQNHDLRGKLVSVHSELTRTEEEAGEAMPAAPLETAAEAAPADAPREAGGEVTDISTLRTRR